jgi:hypothetical protein
LNGAVEPGFAAGCKGARPGPSWVASGWGWVIENKGIFAADERRWTQMSR